MKLIIIIIKHKIAEWPENILDTTVVAVAAVRVGAVRYDRISSRSFRCGVTLSTRNGDTAAPECIAVAMVSMATVA